VYPVVKGKSLAAWLARREWLLDLAAGAALAVTLSLILNRSLFGLTAGDVVQVYYGRF
jgi:hypothetical protein